MHQACVSLFDRKIPLPHGDLLPRSLSFSTVRWDVCQLCPEHGRNKCKYPESPRSPLETRAHQNDNACQLSLRVPLHGQSRGGGGEQSVAGAWSVRLGHGHRTAPVRVTLGGLPDRSQEARCPLPNLRFLVIGCEVGWGVDPRISLSTEGIPRHTGRPLGPRALPSSMSGTDPTPVLPKGYLDPRRHRRLCRTAHGSSSVLEEILARKRSG